MTQVLQGDWLPVCCRVSTRVVSQAKMPRTSKSGAVGKTDAAQVAAETLSVFKAGRYKSFDGVSVTLDKRRLAQANKAAVCIADPLSQFPRPPTDPKAPPPEIILFNGDSFDAARWLVANRDGGDATASATSASGSDKPHGTATAQKNSGCSRPLILDFASDSNPGGGWRGGQQGTQEEALCRCSSLGVALETAYEFSGARCVGHPNRRPGVRCDPHNFLCNVRYMPRMGCVYVPECVVIRANESLGSVPAQPHYLPNRRREYLQCSQVLSPSATTLGWRCGWSSSQR